jgi:hypothetical protein
VWEITDRGENDTDRHGKSATKTGDQPVLDQRDLGLQLCPKRCYFGFDGRYFGSDGRYIGLCRNIVVNGIEDFCSDVFGGVTRDAAVFEGA